MIRKHRAVCVALLAGCTTIGHEPPPADWPALRVQEERLELREMRDRCQRYAPPGYVAEACAEINFAGGWCRISYHYPEHLEHERLHCAGHDHVGAPTLRDAWAAFKRIAAAP